ncbi:MAG: hypothetical protein LUG18_01420 [Candidatus Azobacteroides sp.]|nr:hypothetical protein [Candidatus Azobacteroides sp.]
MNMKQIVLFSGIFFLSMNIAAQSTFRYDTIRTNNVPPAGNGPVYGGNAAFTYDTIRSNTNSGTYSSPASNTNRTTGTNEAARQSSASGRQSSSAGKSSSFDRSRLFLGGSFGIQLGSYTLIDISPQVGYLFNRYLAAGGGIKFTHLKDDDYYADYTRSYLGFNLFANVYPIRNIILSVQPGIDYLWGKDKYPDGKEVTDSKAVPSLLIGGGVNIPTGTVGALQIMVKYDVIQDDYSPYGNSVFYSVGYVFGF